MPVANPAEAATLDRAIDTLFCAAPAQRAAALQRLFVERLDFEPANGEIPLRQEGLPPTAQRIAEREGVDVVLAQLPTSGRLTAELLADALKECKRALSEVFLVATNVGGTEWQFVYPTHRAGREVLRRMAVHRGQPRRTVTEGLTGIYDEAGRIGLRAALENAYDVEAVTKRFFTRYSDIFYQVLAMVTGLPDDEERRLFCQTLFNRLMFLP